jgi:hypothetical protein
MLVEVKSQAEVARRHSSSPQRAQTDGSTHSRRRTALVELRKCSFHARSERGKVQRRTGASPVPVQMACESPGADLSHLLRLDDERVRLLIQRRDLLIDLQSISIYDMQRASHKRYAARVSHAACRIC